MSQQEKPLSEKESLELIATMINKAKDSYYDTGITAIMWGALIAVCALVRLSEIQFDYKLPFDIYLLTLLAIIPQVLISIREKKERVVKSYDDVLMANLWLAFGICIFLLILAVNGMANFWMPIAHDYDKLTGKGISSGFRDFISPFFLMLYGLPTFVTGAVCKFKPMLWGGIFCWACCIITVYTPIRVDHLLTAASAIMAWLIPGILMEREYRLYKKEQATLNV